jgi:glucosamine 6-phosphate synthetase-like amidotransferase/phosphosugar isomerase protein
MCGIFGYTGIIKPEYRKPVYKLLKNLAIASEARGRDSTGFAARYPPIEDGPPRIVADKIPMRASAYVNASPKFLDLQKNMPSSFIGHTRLGTGSTRHINNNNHPFFGSTYHMVHNGVIPSWKSIAKEYKLFMQSETDSEVILRLIEKNMEEHQLSLVRSIPSYLAV